MLFWDKPDYLGRKELENKNILLRDVLTLNEVLKSKKILSFLHKNKLKLKQETASRIKLNCLSKLNLLICFKKRKQLGLNCAKPRLASTFNSFVW